jgi:ribosomal protein L11 methyltransferase
MPALLKISVTTTVAAEDAVSLALQNLFAQPPSIYTNSRTQTSTVSVYCEKTSAWTPTVRRALLAELKKLRAAGLPLGSGKISAQKLPRENWAESWKKHFKPLAVGRTLLLKPSWSKLKPRPGQHVITLDPGLSFGTGHHATTSFCLRELVRRSRRAPRAPRPAPLSFLDIGTGSGILAIAAAKLGYAPIAAFDYDPESLRVARANARLNSELSRLKLAQQDLTQIPLRAETHYDFVCANIIANVLVAERRRIFNRVKPGGTLVLAGILKIEFAAVQRAFEELGLKFLRARNEREWRSGAFHRPASSSDWTQ